MKTMLTTGLTLSSIIIGLILFTTSYADDSDCTADTVNTRGYCCSEQKDTTGTTTWPFLRADAQRDQTDSSLYNITCYYSGGGTLTGFDTREFIGSNWKAVSGDNQYTCQPTPIAGEANYPYANPADCAWTP